MLLASTSERIVLPGLSLPASSLGPSDVRAGNEAIGRTGYTGCISNSVVYLLGYARGSWQETS